MRSASAAVWMLFLAMAWPVVAAEPLSLTLREQRETRPGSGRYHTLTRPESWDPQQTAIILCDVWDSHTCKNAALRVNELVPRLSELVERLRSQGVTVIHAPSDCMEFYRDHAARRRAADLPKSKNLPAEITAWCYQIPAEEKSAYPIDQSDGGNDDTPEEKISWQKELAPRLQGRKWPWIRQHEGIRIDGDRDYISASGDEVWSILEHHGVKNVMLAGVHTNMCVLGRPFGLRQLAKNGKNVVLVRDLTDTMYNPAMPPFVSHFTGTDLIVGHIERCVCPSITSDQILGGTPFRFAGDTRPHVVIVSAEDEYRTEETLPPFAVNTLGKEFRVSLVFGSETERNEIPGLEILQEADALLVSVRRRVLPKDQLDAFRNFTASGRPVIGIRTASHAFCLRNMETPEGLSAWPEFDAEVFGGNYTNHHGNQLRTTVAIVPGAAGHPIVQGIPLDEFVSGGSLYKVSPLKERTEVLMMGRVDGAAPEPVAWTFVREDGGKSFYTSLGHVDDFANPAFPRLLRNALRWGTDQTAKSSPPR